MPTLPPPPDTRAELYCPWHHDWVPHTDAIYMGASPTISGPGIARYACTACIVAYDLVVPPTPGYTNRATEDAA